MIEPHPMAEFFERIGQRTIRSESAWWCEVRSGVLLSFPYYRLLELSDAEIAGLFREHKLRSIRYPTPLTALGFESTVAVNANADYDLTALHQKARNQTRRGLENCVVEQIDFEDLIKHGLPLNQDTARRQGRDSEYGDPAYWRRYCLAAKATPGFSAWAAWVGGELGAHLVVAEYEGWANWLAENSSAALLKQRPNNALVYETARHLFQNTETKRICYGVGSLEPVPELDRFKVRMGWTMQPIKQRLVFSTGVRCLFGLAREPALKLLGRLMPKSYAVRKATGMIRLYRKQSAEVPAAETGADDPQAG